MISAISSALHALGPDASIGGVGSIGGPSSTSKTPGSGSGSGGFGAELSSAIGSLDKTQQTATSASQALADGTATDPTQAVTTVENASMAMDLAASVRDKLVTAESTIFQTQV